MLFQDKDLPIYIWYDNYPSHIAKEYRGRVDRVDSSNRHYGLASLNLTKVTEKDRGWYNCKVLFLDRGPDATVVSIHQKYFNNDESSDQVNISLFCILQHSVYHSLYHFYSFRMVLGIILTFMQNRILSKNLTT